MEGLVGQADVRLPGFVDAPDDDSRRAGAGMLPHAVFLRLSALPALA